MDENDKQAEPVACIGTNGELLWLNKPNAVYSKAVPLYTHPAQPVPPALQGEPHIDRFKSAWIEWSYKTEWVQEKKDWPFNALGMHRADVMKKYIDHLEAQIKAQPMQPAGAQEIKGWLITNKADENESFVTKRPDDWNNSDWKKEPLYTTALADAINEQLLSVARKIRSRLICETEIDSELSIELKAAIAAAEAAKGGV